MKDKNIVFTRLLQTVCFPSHQTYVSWKYLKFVSIGTQKSYGIKSCFLEIAKKVCFLLTKNTKIMFRIISKSNNQNQPKKN